MIAGRNTTIFDVDVISFIPNPRDTAHNTVGYPRIAPKPSRQLWVAMIQPVGYNIRSKPYCPDLPQASIPETPLKLKHEWVCTLYRINGEIKFTDDTSVERSTWCSLGRNCPSNSRTRRAVIQLSLPLALARLKALSAQWLLHNTSVIHGACVLNTRRPPRSIASTQVISGSYTRKSRLTQSAAS